MLEPRASSVLASSVMEQRVLSVLVIGAVGVGLWYSWRCRKVAGRNSIGVFAVGVGIVVVVAAAAAWVGTMFLQYLGWWLDLLSSAFLKVGVQICTELIWHHVVKN